MKSSLKILSAIMFGIVNVMGADTAANNKIKLFYDGLLDKAGSDISALPDTTEEGPDTTTTTDAPDTTTTTNILSESPTPTTRPTLSPTNFPTPDPVTLSPTTSSDGRRRLIHNYWAPTPVDKCYDTTDNSPCTAENIASGHFYFPSCHSCCYFIQCDESEQAFDRPCAPGTFWDQILLTCNHNSGQCLDNNCPSPTPRPTPAPTKSTATKLATPSDDECYDTTDKNPCTRANRLAGNYYFASCTSCCNFIQCDDFGVAFDRPCAPGTFWDQEVLTCNHNNGQCKDDQCLKPGPPTTKKAPTRSPTITTTKWPTKAPSKSKWPTKYPTTKAPTQWPTPSPTTSQSTLTCCTCITEFTTCDDIDCRVTICDPAPIGMPSCCNSIWDAKCVNESKRICAKANATTPDTTLDTTLTPTIVTHTTQLQTFNGSKCCDCMVPFIPCDDNECKLTVCEAPPIGIPECCAAEWNEICANASQRICSVPTTTTTTQIPITTTQNASVVGLCCACSIATVAAGCDADQDCALHICEQDPFCCRFGWDQQCADNAIQICKNNTFPTT